MSAPVGIVGLGPMGFRIGCGCATPAFRRSEGRAATTRQRAAEAGIEVGSARAVAERVRGRHDVGGVPVIITSLPAGPHARDACLGPAGLLAYGPVEQRGQLPRPRSELLRCRARHAWSGRQVVALSPSCPSVVHRHSMGAPDPSRAASQQQASKR
jgi:hypothetical protein